MSQTTTLLDPTGEQSPLQRPRRTPHASLKGKTIALMDIGKTRSDEFLDYLEEALTREGLKTARFSKPTNTKVAPTETLQRIAEEADVLVEALAD